MMVGVVMLVVVLGSIFLVLWLGRLVDWVGYWNVIIMCLVVVVLLLVL